MFRRFKKNRRSTRDAAVQAPVETNPVNFGFFGVYVRSLPTLGR